MRVSQSKIVNFSEKQERQVQRNKIYIVKSEARVKQHKKGDHIVIKSLKDIDQI